MAKVDIPQFMNRWQQKDFTSTDLQTCLEETAVLTQELAGPEKMAPERLSQLAKGLFKAIRGEFRERLATLFAADLRAKHFSPTTETAESSNPEKKEESGELDNTNQLNNQTNVIIHYSKTYARHEPEKKKERWESDNLKPLDAYQVKNAGGIIHVIQMLASSLKPYEDGEREERKFLGVCRLGFDHALMRAQLERGLRAPWRTSYLDLLPGDVKGLNVASFPLSKWLPIAGAMSPGYRNAVVRELNGLTLEDSTVQALGIQDGATLAEFIDSYREGLQRMNLSGCRFVTDDHLLRLAECPNLREVDLTQCERISDKGVQALGKRESLVTLLLKYPGTFQGFNPSGLQNLQRLHFGSIYSNNPNISDADLEMLATLINLEELYLFDCSKITNAGFAHLSRLVNLQKLVLMNADGIGNVGLAYVARLVRLRELTITLTQEEEEDNKITDEGLVCLKELIELDTLNLSGCPVTGTGFKGLSRLSNLILSDCTEITDNGMAVIGELVSVEHLDLSMHDIVDYEDPLSQEGYAQLAKLPFLRYLNLKDRNTSPESLQSFAELVNLQILHLGDWVTDESLQHLVGLINLQELTVFGERITPAGLQHLAKLENLRKLTIAPTITDEGLRHLAGLVNLEELSVGWEITDAGLRHLAGLHNLKKLELLSTQVTPEGIAWLQRQLPNLVITN